MDDRWNRAGDDLRADRAKDHGDHLAGRLQDAIKDGLAELRKHNYGRAMEILEEAQLDAP